VDGSSTGTKQKSISAQPLGTPEGSAIDELSTVEPTMSENMTVTCRRSVMPGARVALAKEGFTNPEFVGNLGE
jgi:hypothetical protein